MKKAILLAAILLMAATVQAANITAIIYTPAVDLRTASDADKELFLEGLLPDNVLASTAYQNATLAEKVEWARENGYVTPYMVKKGLVPLIGSVLTDKYDVLVNYVHLISQGDKHVFQCRLERNGQLPNVRDWIDAYNVGKTDANKIWYWWGNDAEAAYASLWTDDAAFADTVAGKVLRYPAFYHLIPAGVRATQQWKDAKLGEQYQYGIDNAYFDDTQPRMGTVEEAIANGVTIEASVLKKYGPRLRLFER